MASGAVDVATGATTESADAQLLPGSAATRAAPAAIRGGSRAERVWDGIGSVVTFLAMVPQGIFGMLLADLALINWVPGVNVIARLVVDFLIFIAAEEGKRRLIRFYNESSFKGLAEVDVKSIATLAFWAPYNLANYAFSLVASLVFANLATMSLVNAAGLAREYHSSIGDSVAGVFENQWFQYPFAGSSFFANMLSWNGMHKISFFIAINTLKQLYASFFDINREQERLQEEAKINFALKPIVRAYNELVKELKKSKVTDAAASSAAAIADDTEALISSSGGTGSRIERLKTQFLEELRKVEHPTLSSTTDAASSETGSLETVVANLASKNDAALKLALIRIASSEGHETPEVSVGIAVLGKLLGLVFTGLAVAGLSNFYQMAKDVVASTVAEPIAPLLGAMDMVSMAAMAFLCTFEDGSRLLDKLRPETRREYPEILSGVTNFFNLALSTFICLLGGTPNAYQSLKLAAQSIILVALSFYASAHIEFGGFNALTRKMSETAVLPKLNAAAEREGIVNPASDEGESAITFADIHALMGRMAGLHAELPESRATRASASAA